MKAKADVARLLAEAEKRKSKATLLDLAFPRQRRFIDDPSRRKAALCTRRAGKTHGIVLLLLHTALSNPESRSLYCGLTRKAAQDVVFDRLKKINRERGLGGRAHATELYIRFPNGSVIQLLGIDASAEERHKVLGGAYHMVAVDEAASHRQDLREFCDEIIGPACAEVDGTMCLIGTPGNLLNTYFQSVTEGKVEGWSTHKWTFDENPYTKAAMRTEMARLKRDTPGIERTPGFRQMYLAEWVVDEDAKVYKFNSERNRVERMPEGYSPKGWRHVLGIDLGYNDETAYVVFAFNERSTELYAVESYKEKQQDFTLVAQRTKQLMEAYEPYAIVIDPENKQGVEEMRNRHDIPFEVATKGSKLDFIRLMNADLLVGRIKLAPMADSLAEEWEQLVWDEVAKRQGVLKPHPNKPDHLSDAALYAWRRCFNYASKPVDEAPKPGSNEWVEQILDERAERAVTQGVSEWWDGDHEPEDEEDYL